MLDHCRAYPSLPELSRYILGALVVIDLEHTQIPVANHARQVQHVQFFRQSRDGCMPAVVKGQSLDAGALARLAEQGIERGRGNAEQWALAGVWQ